MVQWLGNHLPKLMDPTCCGATKSTGHNYLACALEPGTEATEAVSHNYREARTPQQLVPPKINK